MQQLALTLCAIIMVTLSEHCILKNHVKIKFQPKDQKKKLYVTNIISIHELVTVKVEYNVG